MTLRKEGHWTWNDGDSVQNGLPPGWTRQDPISNVSLWSGTCVFELHNAADAMKIATVRRTFLNGKIDEFKFRVNRASDPTYRVAWLAARDVGSIKMVVAEANRLEGGMEAFDQMEITFDDRMNLRNGSPHWVYVGLQVGVDQTLDTSFLFRRVIPPGSICVLDERGIRPKLQWFAAEPQRTDLYAPFP
jgi:hypothetical protein